MYLPYLVESLNPYYTGSYSIRRVNYSTGRRKSCLNPYYTGSYSIRMLVADMLAKYQRLNPYYTGSYSIRVIIIITSFSTENNRKHKRVTLKKEKKFSF